MTMSDDQHHRDALLETARSELERAHAAAVSMDAAELRRGLELAAVAIREMERAPGEPMAGLSGRIDQALGELDRGELATMERHVEQVRTELKG